MVFFWTFEALDLDLEFLLVAVREVPLVLVVVEGELKGDDVVRNSEGSFTGSPLIDMLGATRVKVLVMYCIPVKFVVSTLDRDS